jgi:hypothetical protein
MRWLRELISGTPPVGDPDESAAMQIRAITVATILGSILVMSTACVTAAWSRAGLIIALAFMLVAAGYILGLLFAMPRTTPTPESDTRSQETAHTSKQRLYSINTNWEQISDWLTKIIVGVGLVNARPLAQLLTQSSSTIAAGFTIPQGPLPGQTAYDLSIAMLIGYPTLGFLLGFFSIRLYIARALYVADRTILKPVDVVSVLSQAGEHLADTPSQTITVPRPAGQMLSISPSSQAVSFEPDSLLQCAAVRIQIEREIRRLCLVARLGGDNDRASFARQLELLVRAELINSELAASLRHIYSVLSEAIHGRLAIDSDAAAIRVASQTLVDRLHNLPLNGHWLELAIVSRARGHYVTKSESKHSRARLKVDDIDIEVVENQDEPIADLISRATREHVVLVSSTEPRMALVSASNASLAWLDNVLFRGTSVAHSRAPWLVDVVIS